MLWRFSVHANTQNRIEYLCFSTICCRMKWIEVSFSLNWNFQSSVEISLEIPFSNRNFIIFVKFWIEIWKFNLKFEIQIEIRNSNCMIHPFLSAVDCTCTQMKHPEWNVIEHFRKRMQTKMTKRFTKFAFLLFHVIEIYSNYDSRSHWIVFTNVVAAATGIRNEEGQDVTGHMSITIPSCCWSLDLLIL